MGTLSESQPPDIHHGPGSALSGRGPWARVASSRDLGHFISRRRRDLGLTQDQVARHLGIHRRYVHEIESGKDMLAFQRLFALINDLGLDLTISVAGGPERFDYDIEGAPAQQRRTLGDLDDLDAY